MAHDGEREQGRDNGRATPDGVIVVAAFAVARVRLIWVGDEVSARARILANYRVCWGPLQTRKDT